MNNKQKRGPVVKTIQQAKRLIKIVIGFTVILGGLAMLFLPGPGIVTIILGLALLGTEFVWAKRLMKRFEKEANNVKNSLLNNSKNKTK